MPKLRTRRTVTKRYKITGSGKITRRRATMGHGMGKKSTNRNRRNRFQTVLDKSNEQQIQRLLNI